MLAYSRDKLLGQLNWSILHCPAGAFCQVEVIRKIGEGVQEARSGDCAIRKSCVPQRLVNIADSLVLHVFVSPVRKDAKGWLELPGQILSLVQNSQDFCSNSNVRVDRQAIANQLQQKLSLSFSMLAFNTNQILCPWNNFPLK